MKVHDFDENFTIQFLTKIYKFLSISAELCQNFKASNNLLIHFCLHCTFSPSDFSHRLSCGNLGNRGAQEVAELVARNRSHGAVRDRRHGVRSRRQRGCLHRARLLSRRSRSVVPDGRAAGGGGGTVSGPQRGARGRAGRAGRAADAGGGRPERATYPNENSIKN